LTHNNKMPNPTEKKGENRDLFEVGFKKRSVPPD